MNNTIVHFLYVSLGKFPFIAQQKGIVYSMSIISFIFCRDIFIPFLCNGGFFDFIHNCVWIVGSVRSHLKKENKKG